MPETVYNDDYRHMSVKEAVYMARPCKRRRVCAMPGCRRFRPDACSAERTHPVVMTIDEYETIRLIDYGNMTQEQCAKQMNIARTTVQSIYNSARRKLAECLVEERELSISGGEYELCDGDFVKCGCGRCGKRKCREGKDGTGCAKEEDSE